MEAMNEKLQKLKTDIIAIGRLLWDKELVSGLNGNISVRLGEDTILLTAHSTCLGLLQDKDILTMKLNGEVLEEGHVSSEKLLHTEIYKNFSEVQAVLHTHTTYTNAYFTVKDLFSPTTFEAKFYLGTVRSVPQLTPSVTDVAPVVERLRANNITVLKRHGVVAMGKDLFDCFLLIQQLEESIKVDAISRLYSQTSEASSSDQLIGHKSQVAGHRLPVTVHKSQVTSHRSQVSPNINHKSSSKPKKIQTKKYKLFSKEQIDEIVRLVNDDSKMKELGEKTQMTMDLAVKLDETAQVYSFSFQNGRINKVGRDPQAEFLISAPISVWKAVFNREIDPFVATTQKKMNLRGDFAKISRWYAPCSRIFELWQRVPVE